MNVCPCHGCRAMNHLRRLVERQAGDSGLWFVAATAPEAYLQRALRDVHTVAEGVWKAFEEIQRRGHL